MAATFHPVLALNAALSSSWLMGCGPSIGTIVTEAQHIQGSIVLGH
jgi:hypothetical protein